MAKKPVAPAQPAAPKEHITAVQRMAALKTNGPNYLIQGRADELMNSPGVKNDPAVYKEALAMHQRMLGKPYRPKGGR